MAILVTGAKGFIGSRLMAALPNAVGVDIGDPLPKEAEGIVHLAGVSRVRDGEKDHAHCLQTNIVETAKLLEIPHDWFIYAGSCEEPKSVYGLSKRCAEDYIRITQSQYVILRLTNVYGPGMPEDKLLPRIRAGKVENLIPYLPFEAVHVDEVVNEIVRIISYISMWKRLTKKLCTSISTTEGELRNVAASY
jgi:nucleoside-diphosphate-sugar epimerase